MLPKITHGDPWKATATHATAAAATVAAATGKTHHITDVSVSSDKSGAILLIKDGSTVIWQVQVGATHYSHSFQVPLAASKGAALEVSIDGTSACKVNASGVTL